jgi:hypothetical protein
MTSRICVCCGDRFSIEVNTLSRNPNICASCSSMADGMEQSNLPNAIHLPQPPLAHQTGADAVAGMEILVEK